MDEGTPSADFPTKDSSICRTCLATSDTLHKVVDLSFEDVSLIELLQNCVSVKVDEDDTSQSICETCVLKVCEIRQFKSTCLNSNDILQQVMRFNLGVVKEENVDLDMDLVTVSGGTSDTCPECPTASNISGYFKQLLMHTGKVVQLCACCGCRYKVKYHGNLIGIQSKSPEDPNVYPNIVSKSAFSEICRTCLSNEENMRQIFDISFQGIPMRDVLDDCISIRAEPDDSLPQQICEPCITKLCGHYAFKLLCFESECVFRQLSDIQDGLIDDIEFEHTSENIKFKRTLKDDDFKLQDVKDCEKRTCPICKKSVAAQSYSRHRQTHNDKSKTYACWYCSARFNLLCNLKRHVMTHTGERPHLCDHCGKSFIQLNTLIEHKRIHTGEKPYVCSTCGKKWSQYSSYKNHIRKPICSGTIKRGIDQMECKMCCGIFTSKSLFRNHNCDETSLTCRICDRNFITRLALKIHAATHNAPKHYTCSYCGDSFDMRLKFTRHMKKHRVTEHICNECGKGFANYSGLWSHRKIHSGAQPYKCTICNRSFSQAGSCKSHMLIHTGEKPYSCGICEKTFTQPNHLKYHMRTHSGEKPYSCNYCGRSFSLNGTLTVHMRKHTGETPYVCNICERGFYDSSSLKRHRSKHSDIDMPQAPAELELQELLTS